MATKKSVWVLFGTLIIVAWLMGFALVTGLGTATAQQAAPTETKGVTPTVLATVDLGSEIPSMQGRQLRLRIVTFEPGGVMEVHSHIQNTGATWRRSIAQGIAGLLGM